MKKILLTILVVFIGIIYTDAQTALTGKVTDAANGEPILFGTIAIYKGGVLVGGAETDLDGNYFVGDISPGNYDVEATYVGYTPQRQTDVIVKGGKTNKLDFAISEGEVLDLDIQIIGYREPLIDFDNTTSGGTVTSQEIRSLPTKSINALAATTAGLSSIDGGAINFRGGRSDATAYYIDGIRVTGLIPESEIEQMQVLTGGLGAEYGDVTGGGIAITTKGPSSKLSGGIEMETSEKLDAFGYNQLRGNLSGPILKNKKGESVIGFRFSGQYQYTKDNNPPATGVYRLSEEKIRELEANPVTTLEGRGVPIASAELLGAADVGTALAARPNEDQRDLDFTGKLDFKLNNNLDLTLSGSFDNENDRFTPSRASGLFSEGTWPLLNWVNNPYDNSKGFRGNIRFRHKLGSTAFDKNATDEERAKKVSSFQNAYYTLQVGYEKRFRNQEDVQHEDNLFNYGYLGSQQRAWTPTANIIQDLDTWEGEVVFDAFGIPWGHQGELESVGDFEPSSDINAILAKYNSVNGNLVSPQNQIWSNLFANVGQVYDQFFKSESERYTFNINSGFDFLPGGSEKGRHSINFGFIYEQQVIRGWNMQPFDLWQIAELSANNHIIGTDYNTIVGTFDQTLFTDGSTRTFNQYETLIETDENLLFFQKVRELTGQSVHDYVNINALNPNDLTLDMFSAAELNDRNILNYYGYDHLGNKIGSDVSFDDFFTSKDADGRRTFLVAPSTPIYGAAFIQDKFTYKDIILRLGLRVDYYDANTKVLKDKFSLYEVETAGEFYSRTGQTQPSAVEDDYRVYIASDQSTSVVGLRKDDQWFLPNGTSVTDGSVIFGGGVVTPALKARAAGIEPNIQSPDFDPDYSFQDYTPQVNYMPRLSFSFPISEDAGFFAHYDILVQRPPSNTIATPLDYFYFSDISRLNPGGPANNPDLKPEKTIDYEVGFQTKISSSSALTISAYYRELRDQIQRRTLTNTYPVTSYEIFDNLDFGTVKGFSFEYDLRRTNNLQFQANYTLQFADGSGSDANSSRGLNSRGAIRTLSALSFDERHRLNAIIDYRYGSGKRYNGPRIGDLEIFANTGLNISTIAVSGRPYTQRRTVTQFGGSGFKGGINESRLPWSFTVDIRLDKSFNLFGGEGKRSSSLNVYLRVQNLLDARNVIGVYSFSGDPDDDGYLLSSFGLDRKDQVASNGQNVENFVDAYNWRLNAPGNYTFPRRIFLGAILEF